ncbi:hypothetical protein H257_10888 [Aphanomyces astaci]|uniref:Acid phosphatase n=1 Tax=Aphanomyces astaci TaxID=112090 RepID=W4G567_APHAT|nr:hypothetical protein H257_10888 [Aphanomyces astaci]ETV74830.1 hypothetical protein H257_10888 [Aphanomyces astaci]|eukprot:XP_009835917.1 hypothetical protein H257_10888 [Aphanomyces astaci]
MKVTTSVRAVVVMLLPCAASHMYPSYCAKDMRLSAIQPLDQTLLSTVELVQVQIVVRHGARTPCYPDSCWKDYDEEWNCIARELSRPSLTGLDDVPSRKHNKQALEFTKVFTAGGNIRRGNCSLGQLTDEGFAQEVQNAKHFRDAYVTSAVGLFAADEAVDLTDPSDVYFESSDIPRTVQSGQTIVQGMFPSVAHPTKPVPWHTQDKAVSTIFPNEANCPTLAAVGKQWLASPEFHAWAVAPANLELDAALDETLTSFSAPSLFDCLMTSKCTDRRIPMSDELFRVTVHREETSVLLQYLFHDSKYSKVAMKAFLQQAITSRLLDAAENHHRRRPLRLALYSVHDSSLMALLAALGGDLWLTEWVPYASHMVFEVYRAKRSRQANTLSDHTTASIDHPSFFVRVLYQGQPLLLGPCTTELCPVDELAALVDAMPSCHVPLTLSNHVAAVKPVPMMMLMLAFGVVVGGGIGYIVAWRRSLWSSTQVYQRL